MSQRKSLRRAVAWLLFAAAALVAFPAAAHKPSDSYLTLTLSGARVEGRWDVALRDLDAATGGLDRNNDGAITWGELQDRAGGAGGAGALPPGDGDVAAYVLGHLAVDADGGDCPIAARGLRVASHSDGAYAVFDFVASCAQAPRTLGVSYSLFFDVDPQHRGIVRIDDGAGTRTAIFSPRERHQTFEHATLQPARQLGAAVRLGVDHIFAGLDHLFFLVALLLPSVLVRRGRAGWAPVARLRPALGDVLRIVTSFTLAHSITLTLSALEILRLPSRVVESGIAASVVVAAVNNVVPILAEDRWAAAFALGLLHGFGFSATLMDLGLPRQNLALTLFGFNVGVELGQLCVVGAFVPIAFLARRTWVYRKMGLVGGSAAIAGIAGLWLVERAFAVKIF